jgi:hypothetical protein
MEAHGKNPTDWRSGFERDGFALIPNVLDEAQISELIQAIKEAGGIISSARLRKGETYAMRNVLESLPAARDLADSPDIRRVVQEALGPGAFPVRGLLFDKTPEANWKVAWHQDLSIAVKRRIEVPGFGPWSVKTGVQHVQPPIAVMERMVALRLHLDDCLEDNGPLQVLPGSHRAGRLGAEKIQNWRAHTLSVSCNINRGGVVLMRPLLLHASSAARRPGHRRVIHLEFASKNLPGGLDWLGA